MVERLAVGIDIGGTKIAAGVVDEDGQILERIRARTPTTEPEAVITLIERLVSELRERHTIKAIGIGAAGYVDVTGSTVLFSPHLAWRHEPLRDRVARRTKLPVLVDNDANASGWAEWRFGAAQNEPDLVMVNLGTGIGGAIVIEGHPYRGHYGMAGEFGHIQVKPNGRRCECGNVGCWEQYASGRVLDRLAQQAVQAQSPVGQRLLELASGQAEEVSGIEVGQLAIEGDAEAQAWLADVGQWLGLGLANLAAALDPRLFVIGGGVIENGDLLLGPARMSFSQHLTGRGYRPEARIVGAYLGADAGLVGAADMARLTARRRRPGSPVGTGRARATGISKKSPRRPKPTSAQSWPKKATGSSRSQ